MSKKFIAKEAISSFPKILRNLREEEQEKQREVAEAIGIRHQSYSAYEKGIALPSLENFLKLCEHFSVTTDEMLGIVEMSERKFDFWAGRRDEGVW